MNESVDDGLSNLQGIKKDKCVPCAGNLNGHLCHYYQSPIPKYLEIKVKKMSKSQERRLKVQLEKSGVEARVQAGSGGLWGAKGDVRTKDELWEHKGTTKKQMVVKEEWLKKIFEEGVKEGRTPCICLEFEGCKIMGEVRKKVGFELVPNERVQATTKKQMVLHEEFLKNVLKNNLHYVCLDFRDYRIVGEVIEKVWDVKSNLSGR